MSRLAMTTSTHALPIEQHCGWPGLLPVKDVYVPAPDGEGGNGNGNGNGNKGKDNSHCVLSD